MCFFPGFNQISVPFPSGRQIFPSSFRLSSKQNMSTESVYAMPYHVPATHATENRSPYNNLGKSLPIYHHRQPRLGIMKFSTRQEHLQGMSKSMKNLITKPGIVHYSRRKINAPHLQSVPLLVVRNSLCGRIFSQRLRNNCEMFLVKVACKQEISDIAYRYFPL